MKTTNLSKDINFITAQSLLDEVRNKLRVYFERSVLDDSVFYPIIRVCLSRLGAKIYPVTNSVVWITEYSGQLPKDFHKLILALGCSKYTVTSTPNVNPQIHHVSDAQINDFLLTNPKPCIDECGENFYIIQRYETFDVTMTETYPLSMSSDSLQYCAGNCWNKQVTGQSQIHISNGKIYTGFKEGSVYIDYLQKLESEDIDGVDLIIPDYPQITEWIKAACIKEAFETMYYNNDADVQQRLMYSKNELTVLEMNAKAFVRRFEFSELYDLRKLFFARYSKYQQVVYGAGKSHLTDRTYPNTRLVR